jgi:hypothetical protein
MATDPDSNPYGALDTGMPAHYDRALGPIFFADFAEDIARRAAASHQWDADAAFPSRLRP